MSSKNEQIQSELLSAISHLQRRGLYCSSKWIAEQLNGLVCGEESSESLPIDSRLEKYNEEEKCGTKSDQIAYIRAKTCFDMKEYLRTANLLDHSTADLNKFLRWFSLFLAGEKQRDEESRELEEHSPVSNPELSNLSKEIQTDYEANLLDGFGKYLYGVVLKETHLIKDACRVLIESCNDYPWNWSAWLALSSICTDYEQLSQFLDQLDNHFMKDFFNAHTQLELQRNEQANQLFHELQNTFSNSRYIVQQIATAHYNLRDFDTAEALFDRMREMDPYSVEGLDAYSNILYVRGSTAKLSYLAHYVCTIDKFRPETCYIIGNYYSLKSQHQKAIVYFQRALKLNSKYLSAWTLMGHEYVELQKPEAAIHAYRKAVDINPRDYRALYGLGQLYEVLKLTQYAIYYYHKAALLRPYDARMWCALAFCYETLERIPEAILCYERAVDNKDHEGLAVKKLAKLYSAQGDDSKAAYYYKMTLESSKTEDKDTIEALLVLGDYCDSVGKTEEAVGYYERLLQYRGRAREHAKSKLLSIHNRTTQ